MSLAQLRVGRQVEHTRQGHGRDEEPLIAWVQLSGQLGVTSSPLPPPTNTKDDTLYDLIYTKF